PDGSPTCRLGRTQRLPTSSRGPGSLRARATALFTCLDRFHGLRRDAYSLSAATGRGSWRLRSRTQLSSERAGPLFGADGRTAMGESVTEVWCEGSDQ